MVKGIFLLEGKKLHEFDCQNTILRRIATAGFKRGCFAVLPDKKIEVVLEGQQPAIDSFHQKTQQNIIDWLEDDYGNGNGGSVKNVIGNPGVKVSGLAFNPQLNAFDLSFFNGKKNLTWFYDKVLKRAFDFLVGLAGLTLVSPLLLLSALLIKLDSKGPVFYTQTRVGRNGKIFKLYKFRTMVPEAEKKTGPVWASGEDPRITRLGHLLRRTNIDELPQLFNVLKGEMSLIGPRPERPYFVEKFRQKFKDYDKRHLVKPGMTGWAQVNGFYGNTPLDGRLKCDLQYIEKQKPGFDFKILRDTAKMFWRDIITHIPKHLSSYP